MALTGARALARARLAAVWNRMRRDSGAGGAWVALALALLVALVLVLPAYTMIRLGREIGATWAAGDATAAAERWDALQAVFALVFPLLAATRFRPAFEPGELGALPVGRGELLLVELPAQLVEVFPLLGLTGLLSSHVGLALGAPGLAPWAALGALQGAIWLLGATVGGGAAWRRLQGLRWPIVGAGAGLLLAATLGDARPLARALARAVVDALPGSWLIDAALAAGAGRPGRAAALGVASAMATIALLAAAARSRLGLRPPQTPRPAALPKRLALAMGRAPIGVVAGTFVAQLLDARAGRALVFLPALLSVPFAIVARAVALDAGALAFVPAPLAEAVRRGAALPLYTLVPVAAVLLDGMIWLNPFGWFRRGIRALLALPLSRRDLAAGTLAGVGVVAALQCLLGLAPLLVVRPPRALELAAGLAGAAAALLLAGGVGQAVGLQFPRGVSRQGGAEIPFHLAWIPPLVVVSTALLVALVHRLAALGSNGAPAYALTALALVLLVGYRAALPLLERELEAKRVRLLAM